MFLWEGSLPLISTSLKASRDLEAALDIYRELKDEQKIASNECAFGLALRLLPTVESPSWRTFLAPSDIFAKLKSGRENGLVPQVWQAFISPCNFSLFAGQIDEAISAAEQARDEYQRHDDPAWIKRRIVFVPDF